MRQNVSFEHMRGIHHRYTLPTGFFARTRHLLRRTFGGTVGLRLEEHYGGGETVDTAQTHAAVNVLGPLTAARRPIIQDWLEEHGIPCRGSGRNPRNFTGKKRVACQAGDAIGQRAAEHD